MKVWPPPQKNIKICFSYSGTLPGHFYILFIEVVQGPLYGHTNFYHEKHHDKNKKLIFYFLKLKN